MMTPLCYNNYNMLGDLVREFVRKVRVMWRKLRRWLRERWSDVQARLAVRTQPHEETEPAELDEMVAGVKHVRAEVEAESVRAPQSLAEFVDVIRRTPRTVLSTRDRARIAAIMSFDERHVRDLMVPRSQMIFVKQNEILGPLVLDKLYKSGFTNFPVVDSQHHVMGVIHTEALNALEIKDTDRADKYLDTAVHYLHTDDTLQTTIDEIERTNSYYFLVHDRAEQLAGFFTIQMLLDYFTK